ncbi:hypothetical protein JCM3774_003426 [Rhodotorula dairenensis]
MPGTWGITDVPTYAAPQNVAYWAMGPAQAGYLVQILLYGVLLALFLNHYTSGELARTGLVGRTALILSLSLNTAYTGLCFYEAFISSVGQNRTWGFLSNADLPWNALPLMGGLIAIVTEVALAHRAGKLLPCAWARVVFGLWMTLLIVAVLTGCILASLAGIFYYHENAFIMHWASSAAIWLWTSAVADVSISLAAAYSLRSRIVGFNRETDSVLRTLIFIVLRTAAYTAIISIVVAVLESVYKDDQLQSFITAALWVPLAALYGIALFTFSVSSRRVIDSRLGVVDLRDPRIPPIERKPAPAPVADQWTASHHTVTVPTSLSRLSPVRSVDVRTPRTPMTVVFQQQRVVHIEEDYVDPLEKVDGLQKFRTETIARRRRFEC